MFTAIVWSAIALGVVVCLLLVRFIMAQRRFLAENGQSNSEGFVSQKDHVMGAKESLLVIANSLLDEQIEVAEGAIRIKILLDHYDPDLYKTPPFSVFEILYRALEHMPTHQARKQTDKKFLHKLDQERYRLEGQHRAEVMRAAKALLIELSQAK